MSAPERIWIHHADMINRDGTKCLVFTSSAPINFQGTQTEYVRSDLAPVQHAPKVKDDDMSDKPTYAELDADHKRAVDYWRASNATNEARIEALTAERDALRDAATEAAKQLRIIAGMDLMGASSTAYNAAREIEAALSRKVAP